MIAVGLDSRCIFWVLLKLVDYIFCLNFIFVDRLKYHVLAAAHSSVLLFVYCLIHIHARFILIESYTQGNMKEIAGLQEDLDRCYVYRCGSIRAFYFPQIYHVSLSLL